MDEKNSTLKILNNLFSYLLLYLMGFLHYKRGSQKASPYWFFYILSIHIKPLSSRFGKCNLHLRLKLIGICCGYLDKHLNQANFILLYDRSFEGSSFLFDCIICFIICILHLSIILIGMCCGY